MDLSSKLNISSPRYTASTKGLSPPILPINVKLRPSGVALKDILESPRLKHSQTKKSGSNEASQNSNLSRSPRQSKILNNQKIELNFKGIEGLDSGRKT